MAFKTEPYHGKAKQILFNGDMVRAILSGQKTQTRRPLTKQPYRHNSVDIEHRKSVLVAVEYGRDANGWNERNTFTPSYQPNDILYVRETWGIASVYDSIKPSDINLNALPGVAFPATDEVVGIKLRPSIHMPKWAARIWLRVTNVRCEKLRKITSEEGIKEGFESRAAFFKTWGEIYPPHQGAASNPFVWIYEFKQVDRSELPEN